MVDAPHLVTELSGVDTLPALLAWRIAKTPHAEAYRISTRKQAVGHHCRGTKPVT